MRALLDRGVLTGGDGSFQRDVDRLSAPGRGVDYRLSDHGAAWLRDFGIDIEEIRSRPRPLIRYCVDWSEQRHHLAGALGAALAQRLFHLSWIEPSQHSRAITVTGDGASGLQATFGIAIDKQGNGSH